MKDYEEKETAIQEQQAAEQEEKEYVSGIPNSVLLAVLGGKLKPDDSMIGESETLAPSIAAKMSRAFGMDVSSVKVSRSDKMKGTGMKGMAQGNRVILSSEVDLNTLEGQEILGHELSHIHAQAQGIGMGHMGLLQDRALEHQADVQGMRAARGLSIFKDTMDMGAGMNYGFGMQGVEGVKPLTGGISASAAAPMQASSGKPWTNWFKSKKEPEENTAPVDNATVARYASAANRRNNAGNIYANNVSVGEGTKAEQAQAKYNEAFELLSKSSLSAEKKFAYNNELAAAVGKNQILHLEDIKKAIEEDIRQKTETENKQKKDLTDTFNGSAADLGNASVSKDKLLSFSNRLSHAYDAKDLEGLKNIREEIRIEDTYNTANASLEDSTVGLDKIIKNRLKKGLQAAYAQKSLENLQSVKGEIEDEVKAAKLAASTIKEVKDYAFLPEDEKKEVERSFENVISTSSLNNGGYPSSKKLQDVIALREQVEKDKVMALQTISTFNACTRQIDESQILSGEVKLQYKAKLKKIFMIPKAANLPGKLRDEHLDGDLNALPKRATSERIIMLMMETMEEFSNKEDVCEEDNTFEQDKGTVELNGLLNDDEKKSYVGKLKAVIDNGGLKHREKLAQMQEIMSEMGSYSKDKMMSNRYSSDVDTYTLFTDEEKAEYKEMLHDLASSANYSHGEKRDMMKSTMAQVAKENEAREAYGRHINSVDKSMLSPELQKGFKDSLSRVRNDGFLSGAGKLEEMQRIMTSFDTEIKAQTDAQGYYEKSVGSLGNTPLSEERQKNFKNLMSEAANKNDLSGAEKSEKMKHMMDHLKQGEVYEKQSAEQDPRTEAVYSLVRFLVGSDKVPVEKADGEPGTNSLSELLRNINRANSQFTEEEEIVLKFPEMYHAECLTCVDRVVKEEEKAKACKAELDAAIHSDLPDLKKSAKLISIMMEYAGIGNDGELATVQSIKHCLALNVLHGDEEKKAVIGEKFNHYFAEEDRKDTKNDVIELYETLRAKMEMYSGTTYLTALDEVYNNKSLRVKEKLGYLMKIDKVFNQEGLESLDTVNQKRKTAGEKELPADKGASMNIYIYKDYLKKLCDKLTAKAKKLNGENSIEKQGRLDLPKLYKDMISNLPSKVDVATGQKILTRLKDWEYVITSNYQEEKTDLDRDEKLSKMSKAERIAENYRETGLGIKKYEEKNLSQAEREKNERKRRAEYASGHKEDKQGIANRLTEIREQEKEKAQVALEQLREICDLDILNSENFRPEEVIRQAAELEGNNGVCPQAIINKLAVYTFHKNCDEMSLFEKGRKVDITAFSKLYPLIVKDQEKLWEEEVEKQKEQAMLSMANKAEEQAKQRGIEFKKLAKPVAEQPNQKKKTKLIRHQITKDEKEISPEQLQRMREQLNAPAEFKVAPEQLQKVPGQELVEAMKNSELVEGRMSPAEMNDLEMYGIIPDHYKALFGSLKAELYDGVRRARENKLESYISSFKTTANKVEAEYAAAHDPHKGETFKERERRERGDHRVAMLRLDEQNRESELYDKEIEDMPKAMAAERENARKTAAEKEKEYVKTHTAELAADQKNIISGSKMKELRLTPDDMESVVHYIAEKYRAEFNFRRSQAEKKGEQFNYSAVKNEITKKLVSKIGDLPIPNDPEVLDKEDRVQSMKKEIVQKRKALADEDAMLTRELKKNADTKKQVIAAQKELAPKAKRYNARLEEFRTPELKEKMVFNNKSKDELDWLSEDVVAERSAEYNKLMKSYERTLGDENRKGDIDLEREGLLARQAYFNESKKTTNDSIQLLEQSILVLQQQIKTEKAAFAAKWKKDKKGEDLKKMAADLITYAPDHNYERTTLLGGVLSETDAGERKKKMLEYRREFPAQKRRMTAKEMLEEEQRRKAEVKRKKELEAADFYLEKRSDYKLKDIYNDYREKDQRIGALTMDGFSHYLKCKDDQREQFLKVQLADPEGTYIRDIAPEMTLEEYCMSLIKKMDASVGNLRDDTIRKMQFAAVNSGWDERVKKAEIEALYAKYSGEKKRAEMRQGMENSMALQKGKTTKEAIAARDLKHKEDDKKKLDDILNGQFGKYFRNQLRYSDVSDDLNRQLEGRSERNKKPYRDKFESIAYSQDIDDEAKRAQINELMKSVEDPLQALRKAYDDMVNKYSDDEYFKSYKTQVADPINDAITAMEQEYDVDPKTVADVFEQLEDFIDQIEGNQSMKMFD